MSESKTPQAGEWWGRDKTPYYYIVGYSSRGKVVYQTRDMMLYGDHTGWRSDIVHLPDCTGWDWKEPQKPPAKPDPGKGYRLLEPGELVIQGDEYWEPKGTPRWEGSDNWRSRSGEQSPELVYRRRKEKPSDVVSLDTYEKVVAERNALLDRMREIEAKAKFYESVF